MRHSSFQCRYRARIGVVENLLHLFQRGPRFVDYYFRSLNRYSVAALVGIIIFTAITLWLGFELSTVIISGILGVFLLAATALLSERWTDVLVVPWALPLCAGAFGIGCLWGIVLQVWSAWQRWTGAIRVVLCVASIAAMAAIVVAHGINISGPVRWSWLVLSVLACTWVDVSNASVYQRSLASVGHNIRLLTLLEYISLGKLASYVVPFGGMSAKGILLRTGSGVSLRTFGGTLARISVVDTGLLLVTGGGLVWASESLGSYSRILGLGLVAGGFLLLGPGERMVRRLTRPRQSGSLTWKLFVGGMLLVNLVAGSVKMWAIFRAVTNSIPIWHAVQMSIALQLSAMLRLTPGNLGIQELILGMLTPFYGSGGFGVGATVSVLARLSDLPSIAGFIGLSRVWPARRANRMSKGAVKP